MTLFVTCFFPFPWGGGESLAMLKPSGLAVGDERDMALVSRSAGRVSWQRRWW